jgi:hypothetical protein
VEPALPGSLPAVDLKQAHHKHHRKRAHSVKANPDFVDHFMLQVGGSTSLAYRASDHWPPAVSVIG